MQITNLLEPHVLAGLRKPGLYGVVAASPGDGATTTTLAVAQFMSSELTPRLLLIDGNLRDPGLHKALEAPPQPGLSDLLTDPAADWDGALVSLGNRGDLIPAGPEGNRGALAMHQARFKELLDRMRQDYPYILVDMGSPQQSPGVLNIAHMFDGIIQVVCCHNTRWEVAQDLKEKLEEADGNILGAIMNRREFFIPRWLYKFV